MSPLMDGFPPSPEAQVTLANWRTAPFSRWAFHHVRELLPTADIVHDPANVRELPLSSVALAETRVIPWRDLCVTRILRPTGRRRDKIMRREFRI